MRLERQFAWFLTAWTIVSLCNAALNAYAPGLPSLPYRGAALGALLLLASTAHCRDRPARRSRTPIEVRVYAALFAAIGVPSVAWRYISPLDVSGLASLNHGASIAFVFGTITLIIARLANSSHLADDAARGAA